MHTEVQLANSDGLLTILVFMLGGVSFLLVPIFFGRFIRPNKPNAEKNAPYESGEEAQGKAHGQYHLRFSVVALLFLLFEVEFILVYPLAVVIGDPGLNNGTDNIWGIIGFIEFIAFIFFLAIGLAYAWSNGYLDWEIKSATNSQAINQLPKSIYNDFNEKLLKKP